MLANKLSKIQFQSLLIWDLQMKFTSKLSSMPMDLPLEVLVKMSFKTKILGGKNQKTLSKFR